MEGRRTVFPTLLFAVVMLLTMDAAFGCSTGQCGSYAGVNFGTCCTGYTCSITGFPPGVCTSSCAGQGSRCGSYGGVNFGTCCNGLSCRGSGYPPGTCVRP